MLSCQVVNRQYHQSEDNFLEFSDFLFSIINNSEDSVDKQDTNNNISLINFALIFPENRLCEKYTAVSP